MQQDWDYLENLRREKHAEWLRNLSPHEAFAIAEELFELAQQQRDDSSGWKHLEANRRKEKTEIRLKMRDAFLKLDKTNDTDCAEADSGRCQQTAQTK